MKKIIMGSTLLFSLMISTAALASEEEKDETEGKAELTSQEPVQSQESVLSVSQPAPLSLGSPRESPPILTSEDLATRFDRWTDSLDSSLFRGRGDHLSERQADADEEVLEDGLSLIHQLDASSEAHLFLDLSLIRNVYFIKFLQDKTASCLKSVSFRGRVDLSGMREGILQEQRRGSEESPESRETGAAPFFNAVADLFKFCGTVVNLDMVMMHSYGLTDQDIKQMVDFGQHSFLKGLSLENNQVTDHTIPYILRLKDLTYLNLSKNPLNLRNPNPWENIPSFPSLVFLDLSQTGLNDKALSSLLEGLGRAPLKKLLLEGNQITGEGLGPQRINIPTLQQVSLKNNRVTYQGLRSLSQSGLLSAVSLTLENNHIGPSAHPYRRRHSAFSSFLMEQERRRFDRKEEREVMFLLEQERRRHFGHGGREASIDWPSKIERLFLSNNDVRGMSRLLFQGEAVSLERLDISSDILGLEEVIHVLTKAPQLEVFSVKDVDIGFVGEVMEGNLRKALRKYEELIPSETLNDAKPKKDTVREQVEELWKESLSLWPSDLDLKVSSLFPFLKGKILEGLNRDKERSGAHIQELLEAFIDIQKDVRKQKGLNETVSKQYEDWKKELEKGKITDIWSFFGYLYKSYWSAQERIKAVKLLDELKPRQDRLRSLERAAVEAELRAHLIESLKRKNPLLQGEETRDEDSSRQVRPALSEFLSYSWPIIQERVELETFVRFIKKRIGMD